MRSCIHCVQPFEPAPAIEERLREKGSYQKVCAGCALQVVDNIAAEAVFDMTEEEAAAELRAEGYDLEKLKARVVRILEAAKRKEAP